MARQPLLEDDRCFEDGLDDGIVPPDPLAGANVLLDEEQGEELEDYNNVASPTKCIQKLGLVLGMSIGITMQLAALAGNLVNAKVWVKEDGPYATTIFLVWCCFLSSLFFVAFGLLRCLVQMSLKMVHKMEQEKPMVVLDIPSDIPLPAPRRCPSRSVSFGDTPLSAPSRCPSRRVSFNSSATQQDEDELLEDVMWHMNSHYVLGINLGISLSWLATNVALGDHRVPLIFSLVPALLGLGYFWWVKHNRVNQIDLIQEDHIPQPTDVTPDELDAFMNNNHLTEVEFCINYQHLTS